MGDLALIPAYDKTLVRLLTVKRKLQIKKKF